MRTRGQPGHWHRLWTRNNDSFSMSTRESVVRADSVSLVWKLRPERAMTCAMSTGSCVWRRTPAKAAVRLSAASPPHTGSQCPKRHRGMNKRPSNHRHPPTCFLPPQCTSCGILPSPQGAPRSCAYLGARLPCEQLWGRSVAAPTVKSPTGTGM